MGLVDLIEKLINERGSAAVMKERLELVKEKAEILEQKTQALQSAATTLEEENAKLRSQLAKANKAAEFEEHQGTAFKKNLDGKFKDTAYCPIHCVPASALHRNAGFVCSVSSCDWVSSITPNELPGFVRKLNDPDAPPPPRFLRAAPH